MKRYNIYEYKSIIFTALFFATFLFFGFSVKQSHNENTSATIANYAGLHPFLQSDEPGENEIWMNDLTFIPKIKKIKVGTTITWINKETAMHTIVSGTLEEKTGRFESKRLGKGGKFSFTFKEKGIYKYYCGTHSDQMDGVIIVK